MQTPDKNSIKVETSVQLPTDKVWELWTEPKHITQWNFAVDSWHCPIAENDLRPDGRFSWRMEAKDGSMGFDYCGNYNKVIPSQQIICTLDDGRKVTIDFINLGYETRVLETFETEDTNSIDQQRAGWQAILDNFKKYAEIKNKNNDTPTKPIS